MKPSCEKKEVGIRKRYAWKGINYVIYDYGSQLTDGGVLLRQWM